MCAVVWACEMNPRTHRIRRHVLGWTLALTAAGLFHVQFTFGVNVSPSLPQSVFLIHKGERPHRGDYVAFRWAGGGPYEAGTTFVKILQGVPGDTVQRYGRSVFLNGQFLSVAKPLGKQGQRLEPGPEGVISDDHVYVHAPHPDSLDSRYALTGWIERSRIIGRAYALF